MTLALPRSAGQRKLSVERMESAETPSVIVHVAGLTCTECAAQFVDALRAQTGVQRVELDYVTGQLDIWGNIAPNEISKYVRDMGYEPIRIRLGQVEHKSRPTHRSRLEPLLVTVSAVFIIAGIVANELDVMWPFGFDPSGFSPTDLCFIAATIIGAFYPLRKSAYSVYYGAVDSSVVVTLAAAGVVVLSRWFDSAVLLFLYGFANMAEAGLLDRLRYNRPKESLEGGMHDHPVGLRSRGDRTIGERMARYFVAAMIFSAFLVGSVPTFLFGMSIESWIYPALILLVMSRPAPLVMGAPTALIAVTHHVSQRGIYVKDRATWRDLSRINGVIFHQTGTLTEGRIAVFEVAATEQAVEGEILDIAASVLERTDHSAATAIVETATMMERQLPGAQSVFPIQGLGAEGYIDDRRYIVGTVPLMRLKGVDLTPLSSYIGDPDKAGNDRMIVADSDRALGVILLADPIREESYRTIRRIRTIGIEKIAMMSPDEEVTAGQIAGQLGIDECYSNLSVEDQQRVIEEWKEKGYRVAVIGEVGDPGATLTQADVSIALRGGPNKDDEIKGETDVEDRAALGAEGPVGEDTAGPAVDVDVMVDGRRLTHIPHVIALARRYRYVAISNFLIAVAFKAMAVYMLVVGDLTLGLASLIEFGSSLVITGRSARLKRRIRISSRRRRR